MKKEHSAYSELFSRRDAGLSTTRRTFMKTLVLGALAVPASTLLSRTAFAAQAGGDNVLIIYFSHSGNTRRLAGFIHDRVGGRMVELKTERPYP